MTSTDDMSLLDILDSSIKRLDAKSVTFEFVSAVAFFKTYISRLSDVLNEGYSKQEINKLKHLLQRTNKAFRCPYADCPHTIFHAGVMCRKNE